MWILIALPLNLILLVLVNCYIRKDLILSKETFKDRLTSFVPSQPLYIMFLIIVFTFGIVSFGSQYYYFADYVKAAKLTTLVLLLAPVAYIDFKSKTIPNKLLLAGLFGRIIFYIIEMFTKNREILDIFVSDIKGVLLGGGVFLLGAIIAKNSVGMGDVKMYGVIGFYCGYMGTMASMLFSLFICFIASIFLLIFRKKSRKDTLPLAPFVLAGTFLVIFLGSY